MHRAWKALKQWACITCIDSQYQQLRQDEEPIHQTGWMISMEPTEPPPYSVCEASTVSAANDTTKSDSLTSSTGQFLGGWLRLTMLDDPTAPSYWLGTSVYDSTPCHVTPWHAELEIYVKDMPKLMRQGLNWSGQNVIVDGGFLTTREEALSHWHRSVGWSCVRRYKLRDHSEDPQWEGNLLVYARQISELSCFRLSNLSVNKVRWALAFNKDNEHVYNFDRLHTAENFNTYYDDMPLQGWWPWPKVEEAPKQGGGHESEDGGNLLGPGIVSDPQRAHIVTEESDAASIIEECGIAVVL
ncbi:hypothetical protein BGZ63DRAFT_426053 [Mariannaea sp. PMI_226]|nr:hypothetical protein BGZ63DRAFT_426053 [Mariannaea sp. PMI_226]